MYLKSRSDNFHLIKLILCCLGEKMEKSDSNLSEPKLGFVVFFDFDSIRERDTDIDPPPTALHTIWTGIHFCCTACWEWFHLYDFCCWEWIKSVYRLATIFCFQSATRLGSHFPIDYRTDLLRHGNNKSKKTNSLNNSLNANESSQNCKQYHFTKFCICLSQVVFIFGTIFKEMLKRPIPTSKKKKRIGQISR